MRFKPLKMLFLLLLPSTAAAQLDEAALEPHENATVVDITISGHSVTKDYVIWREIHTKVGEPFQLELLRKDVSRLDNLGIFASVKVVPVEYAIGVGLDFHFREVPWIIPYVALRYNEENGWSGGPAVSSVNLLGRDMYLSGRLLVGGVNTFEVDFSWPWITGNHVSFDFLGAHLVRDNVILDFEESSYEITPWVGTFIGEHGRARVGVSWFRMHSDSAGITLSDDNVDNLHRVGAAMGYDNRDSWRNPHRGWWHEVQVFKTGGRLGGDGDFWTWDFDLERYQPTWRDQTLVMGLLTTLQTGVVGVDVPSYLQYFMGGANSIRGYEYEELGSVLFGKNQLILTLEYQFTVLPIRALPIWKWAIPAGLQVAIFSDTGTAWSSDDEFTRDRIKTGIGAGLRILIPAVDVARVDIAVGEDGKVVFHFGIWPKMVAQRFRVR
jgi:outer membrane protein insertion porin family